MFGKIQKYTLSPLLGISLSNNDSSNRFSKSVYIYSFGNSKCSSASSAKSSIGVTVKYLWRWLINISYLFMTDKEDKRDKSVKRLIQWTDMTFSNIYLITKRLQWIANKCATLRRERDKRDAKTWKREVKFNHNDVDDHSSITYFKVTG